MIVFERPGVTLHHGDCIEVMRALPDNSVHAVVTDPPYGLEFMGKEWDSFRGDVGRGVRVAEERATEMTPTGKGHSTSAGPYLAARVDSIRSAGLPFQRWCEEWAREAFRVLKPGGHMLAFGGSRTWHRLQSGIEDAGFEIRDSVAWLYGSGFPKSLDVSKAIDSANGRKFEDRYALGRHIRERREASGLSRADVNGWFGYKDGCEHWERQDVSGARVPTMSDFTVLRERLGLSDEFDALVERVEAEREVIGSKKAGIAVPGEKGRHTVGGSRAVEVDITLAATDAAREWEGWGTALKPAFEPIVVARKPLAGTVARNVLEHGTGALNIDAARVGDDRRVNPAGSPTSGGSLRQRASSFDGDRSESEVMGRWPTNVVLDESQAAELDKQSGVTKSPPVGSVAVKQARINQVAKGDEAARVSPNGHGDSGGASRFFPTFRYEAKAPGSERPDVDGVMHPTVKPLDLMRWLVRLVTPKDGIILEPFAGSGTTLEAALLEGFKVIGIEREADYLPLIEARITKPLQVAMFGDWEVQS